METLLEMLKEEGKVPDVFIVMQMMRCYLHSGDIDCGHKIFEDYMNYGKAPVVEPYVVNMNSRRSFLNHKMGSDLLLAASGEKIGGYTTANFIWDVMQAHKTPISYPAVEAYYNGLKEREIPKDDLRLLLVFHTYDNLCARFWGPGRQAR